MSKFFITRPIFAAVISIIIVLAGIAAALKLSIAQYPKLHHLQSLSLLTTQVQVLKHSRKQLQAPLKNS